MMTYQCSYNLRLAIILLYLIIFSHIEHKSFAQEKICGRALATTLAAFCANRFNGRIKRSLDLKMVPSDGSWYYRLKDILRKLELEPNESSPEIFKIDHLIIKENKILIRKRKDVYIVTSKGVADECCIQACVYDDIIKYCA